jgi:hypothetical protein
LLNLEEEQGVSTKKETMAKAAINPDHSYEENLAGDLSTFAVSVLTFLHIMFLERK